MTKHKDDCNMAFGRKDNSCPRCIELINGAQPRQAWNAKKKEAEARQLNAIRNHNFAACAKVNGVCTHFDW